MPRLAPDYHGYKPPRWAYLRSFLPVIALIILFSFSLSTYSLLSHIKSPAKKQQIGWQSWDVVDTSQLSSGSSGEGDENELEVGSNDTTNFVPSIPLDNWDPTARHTTGLTQIAIKACYFPPWLFGSYCAPETTPELDKTLGKWVIVEKDLNVKTGLWYLNLYYRRTRRLDARLITDIRLLEHPPSAEDQATLDSEKWTLADGDLRNGVWPTQPEMRLWYKLRDQEWGDWGDWKRRKSLPERDDLDDAIEDESGGTEDSGEESSEIGDDDILDTPTEDEGSTSSGEVEEIGSDQSDVDWTYGDFINELDPIFGDDEPFFGFQRAQGGPIIKAETGRWESVDISYRKGSPDIPAGVVPTFHSDGTLKILQIADLHYSVGNGECRDTDSEDCIGDPNTAAWLAGALDAEKPDLVIFSGDQLNGQSTSYDTRSVLAKFAKPVIDRGIPWAAVLGNHDSEDQDDRRLHMKNLQNMPYSLSRSGPKSVDGVGNYYIKLHSSDASRTHVFTLYFLDSHSYQKKSLPWLKADYDYLKSSQIDWYHNVSSSIKPIERPFHPDGGSDLGSVWSRRSQPDRLHDRDTTLAKPNAMMWFHIPLVEAYNAADQTLEAELDVGDQYDFQGSSKHNSGFFYNAIKTNFEGDTEANSWVKQKAEVKVTSHGHCHNTDRCRRVDGVWMCFDGGSSFSGYGQLGFDRRVRVYKISEYGEKIETYKRLTDGQIIDEQVLVGEGAVSGWGEDQ